MPIITISMTVSPPGSGTILTNGQRIDTIQMYSGTLVTWQAIPSPGQKFGYFILPTGLLAIKTIDSNSIIAAPDTSGTVTAVFLTALCPEVVANLTTT